jgi:Cu+-exporting ATPase
MAIESAQAGASRTLGQETFYFCSEHCAERFDREHAGSATTGDAETGKLRRIELSVADLDGPQ